LIAKNLDGGNRIGLSTEASFTFMPPHDRRLNDWKEESQHKYMIIEIALGIVLAIIILRFLPALLGLGFVLLMVGVVIVIALAIVYFGYLYFWPILAMVSVLAIFGGALVIQKKFSPTDEQLVIVRRRALGYDLSPTDVRNDLDTFRTPPIERLKAKLLSLGHDFWYGFTHTASQRERERRRHLGYTVDNSKPD
jgi:hypothetical protein